MYLLIIPLFNMSNSWPGPLSHDDLRECVDHVLLSNQIQYQAAWEFTLSNV